MSAAASRSPRRLLGRGRPGAVAAAGLTSAIFSNAILSVTSVPPHRSLTQFVPSCVMSLLQSDRVPQSFLDIQDPDTRGELM